MTWRRRFLSWVAPLLLLAQLALVVHQLEHRIAPQAGTSAHECVLCSAANGAAPPPEPFAILAPDFGPGLPVHYVADAACCAHIDGPFSPRGPPRSAAL